MNTIKTALILILSFNFQAYSQQLKSDNKELTEAFRLAVNTVDINVRRGVLAAGGDYGGEWTRDIAINSWNGVSLIRPQVALNSLWSVTVNKDSIGHQYWDKIIWTVAALNHYKVTGDLSFLKNAHLCSKNTMDDLEQTTFDEKYGLFMGPSVFNDGIAGYPESVFDSLNNSSFVLNHKNAKNIKCLSTNSLYYGAYLALADMSKVLNDGKSGVYFKKATLLKAQILKYLYNGKENKLYYLIDSDGKINHSQEALGLSFSVLFGVLDPNQASAVIDHAKTSVYGIPSIYPDFLRYSSKKPGRHNNIIWPMVNGFFASAASQTKNYKVFTAEFNNLTHLALDEDKGNYNFREIYNATTGVPDGGWQRRNTETDFHWPSFKTQTWSATAYLSMVLNGLFGIKYQLDGLYLAPFLPENTKTLSLQSLIYRKAILDLKIEGQGSYIASFMINGKIQKEHKIPATATGRQEVIIKLSQK